MDPRSTTFYFVGYHDRYKGYRLYCTFGGTKTIESVEVKFFENGDSSKISKVMDIVFEEECQVVSIPIV